MKATVRSLIAIALIISAPLAYGMPFSELASVPRTVPVTESTTLLLVGVAMLLFARGARRRSTSTGSSQHF